MKNILLIATSMLFLHFNLIAEAPDSPLVLRLNVIHIEEIEFFGESDPGMGTTAEFAYIFNEDDDVFQSVGLEVGYIYSEIDDFVGFEIDINLIPIFLNYTFGGDIGDSGFVWDAGVGIGGVSIKVDDSIDSERDFVLGGQIFGSLGKKITEALCLSAGIRYMTSSEADIFGEFSVPEDEILNSTAVDLSLNFTF